MPPSKVSLLQKTKLLDFIERHRDIGIGGPSKGNSQEDDRYWREIAAVLNHTIGACRTYQGWRKYWSDLKCRVRKREVSGKTRLAMYEKRLLSIVGRAPSYLQNQSKVNDYTSFEYKLDPEEHFVEERLDEDMIHDTKIDYVDRSGSPDHVYLPNDPIPIMEDHNDQEAKEDEKYAIKATNCMKKEDNVPSWVREVEDRRLALEERTAMALEKVANGITSISASMDRMSRAMLSLVGSVKQMDDTLRSKNIEK